MRDGGPDDLLEGLLGLDLLVEYSKRHILEVDDLGVFPIIINLLSENAEDELLLILLPVSIEIDICLAPGALFVFQDLSLDKLLLPLVTIMKVYVFESLRNHVRY